MAPRAHSLPVVDVVRSAVFERDDVVGVGGWLVAAVGCAVGASGAAASWVAVEDLLPLVEGESSSGVAGVAVGHVWGLWWGCRRGMIGGMDRDRLVVLVWGCVVVGAGFVLGGLLWGRHVGQQRDVTAVANDLQAAWGLSGDGLPSMLGPWVAGVVGLAAVAVGLVGLVVWWASAEPDA